LFFISAIENDSYQKLKIEESTNNNATIVEQIESIKISNNEHVMLPKNKTVLDRFVKTVGNISTKVIPQKWNKNKKSKVKCTNSV